MDNIINPVYLEKETLQKVKNHFKNQVPNSIQLSSFLTKDAFTKFFVETVSRNWELKNEIMRCSYYNAKLPKELKLFIESKMLSEFVSSVVQKKITLQKSELQLFYHENYTLLEDKNQQGGFVFILEFTPQWNNDWGGYTSFVKSEDELLRINPSQNSFTIVSQSKEMKHFTKYVNHHTKEKRIFLIGLFK